jgi:serine/threonine-protein kinase
MAHRIRYSPVTTTQPPTRFGPYLLEQRIAVGGTAEVYLARPADDRAEPRRLIVKRLLPHIVNDTEGRTMFQREAALHEAVRKHENVVAVFGAGLTPEGEPYLAMEYVDGVDGYRLLRKMRQEGQTMAVGLAVHIGCEVLRALDYVHSAKDEKGKPLGIVHRDVTPSNIYLSKEGRTKLGDFGIARSSTRMTLRSEHGEVLKGKFGYLAPEQVSSEPFDGRADLFSMATVLSEMLLGKPLFPGGGQLAVLLAIRDCRVEALTEIKDKLPAGLYDVVMKGLTRDPKNRYQRASEFVEALAPFEPPSESARSELAQKVRWVQMSTPSTGNMRAVRDSASKMRAVRTSKPASESPPDSAFERPTGEYTLLPSFVEMADGRREGPWQFAKLIEALATGQVGRGDKVDYMGRGMKPAEQIEELQRFLPAITSTTNQFPGPGTPDFSDDLATTSMLAVLVKILEQRETGVLFAERPAGEQGEAGRKELYFINGQLHHVASSNASELLGEYLVRRGKLVREELDLALAVLPRYNGRMGDTLISLGLVGPVDIFRAIREQGRDRVADLFMWRQGTVNFYRGQKAPHVEFPLDLDLPSLMLAGLETQRPLDTPLEHFRTRLEHVLAPAKGDDLFTLDDLPWPSMIQRVRTLTSQPKALRDVLKGAARAGNLTASDVLRAVEILLAARLLQWKE